MNKQKLIVGVVVAVSLILSLIAVSRPGTVTQTVREIVGANSGPDSSSPYISNNGIVRFFGSSALNQASTTVCSLKSPSATSTLIFGSVQITTGTTTALAVEIAKDATYAATTTRLSYALLPSGAKATILAASTTVAALSPADQDAVFGPNQYFNVKIGGANGAGNVLVGSCKAEFVLN